MLNQPVIKTIKHRKEAITCQIQLKQIFANKKKDVKILTVIIKQSCVDNIITIANEIKLKKEKESKRSVMTCTLSSFSKSTKSFLITIPLPISTNSFFAVSQPQFFFLLAGHKHNFYYLGFPYRHKLYSLHCSIASQHKTYFLCPLLCYI